MAERLLFSRSLYSPEAVDESVRAFSHLAKLAVVVHDDAVELTMDEPDPELSDVLLDEIANHVLAGSIARGRKSA
jgi:hypothetical protein